MRIGIDLGGTKIEIIALDRAGATLARRRVASPATDYGAVLDTIAELVDDVESRTGQRGSIGIGLPGSQSRNGGFQRNSNSTALNGMPFVHDVTRRLGRDVRVENDANCFALSEASDGAAAGASTVFGIILGTGVGGGIVVGGRLLGGASGIAGEWGHNPLPWPADEERPGPRCYCGKNGCIETFLSGPSLARDHLASGGAAADARAIAAAALAGDPVARASVERYVDRLARALATVIDILDPDTVVVGGGLSNVAAIYRDVPERLKRYVFSDTVATRIVAPAHGDSSGVRGAAWLWPAT